MLDTNTAIYSTSLHLLPSLREEEEIIGKWSVRLVDEEQELRFRDTQFQPGRTATMVTMLLLGLFNCLSLGVEWWYAAKEQLEYRDALYGRIAMIGLAALAWVMLRFARNVWQLEAITVATLALYTVLLSVQHVVNPVFELKGAVSAVALTLLIYIYAPVRFWIVAAVAMFFSVVNLIAWAFLRTPAPDVADVSYIALLLLFANALGGYAAYAANRNQRMLFARTSMLEHLSSVDFLTGLTNRRKFDAILQREWRRAVRSGTPLTVMIIDVDHFKLLNDHSGHLVGDTCLRIIAETLQQTLTRASDVVARYGGEEFACLLPNISSTDARRVAELLRHALAERAIPHPASPLGANVTVSIGVATGGPGISSPTELLNLADTRLYNAKLAGRDRFIADEEDSIPWFKAL